MESAQKLLHIILYIFELFIILFCRVFILFL